ncbi:hypothetical protein AHAS_Ahas15G0181900 [Arachis hypogaea]
MSDPDTWPRHDDPKVIANCILQCTTKGRSNSTRYLNEMNSRDICASRQCTL